MQFPTLHRPAFYRYRRRTNQGFSLMELSIALMIISILGVIAVPNLLNALERGRQGSTLQDMRTIGTALERYAADYYRYPAVDEIGELRPLLSPDYVKKIPILDGWGNLFAIEVIEDGTSYTIRSAGKDGEFQTGELEETTQSFKSDIVYSDGVFLQRPAGQQE